MSCDGHQYKKWIQQQKIMSFQLYCPEGLVHKVNNLNFSLKFMNAKLLVSTSDVRTIRYISMVRVITRTWRRTVNCQS